MMIDEKPDWQKEYERIRGNAIYFIEAYYNKRHPKKKVILTDEEKQVVFNKYKKIPFYNDFSQMDEVEKKTSTIKGSGV